MILDQGERGISVAQIDWYEEPILVMKWNISLREWDDPKKISEEDVCLGMPVSRGYPVWFVIPEELWDFSRKSISDWKNIYFDECTKCSKLTECGGMFKSSVKKHSNYIKAFIN